MFICFILNFGLRLLPLESLQCLDFAEFLSVRAIRVDHIVKLQVSSEIKSRVVKVCHVRGLIMFKELGAGCMYVCVALQPKDLVPCSLYEYSG